MERYPKFCLIRAARPGCLHTYLKISLTIFWLFGPSGAVSWPSDRAFGQTPGAVSPTAQQVRDGDQGNSSGPETRALEEGRPIRRELAGGQQHNYQIGLNAGQCLKVTVEQNGIDVTVKLAEPDGKQTLEFDSESNLRGSEPVMVVAGVAGDYRLTVQPKQPAAPAGSYEIRIDELRPATETDRLLHEARRWHEQALRLQRTGKFDEALPLAERALEAREKALGPDHRDVATTVNLLAVLYHSKGNYAKAEPLYRRAVAVREKTLGPDHPQVAASLNNLAVIYRDKGELAKAEPLYLRALSIWEKALGPDHPDLANTLNNLAILYQNTGEHPKAERLLRRALAIREKALGPDHVNVADSLNNLANVYYGQGDYVKAESLYQQVLTIKEKALGPEHPDVAVALNNLGIIYRLGGDYAKAEQIHQRALAIREKALGPEHPTVIVTLNHLAEIYCGNGDYAKAEPLYLRTLASWEKAFGSEHYRVAEFLDNLANLYRLQGDEAKAEPLYQRGLAIREKALGPVHPYVAASLNSLVEVALIKGEIARAVAWQSRANRISERHLELNLATGSERQKQAYLSTLAHETDRTLSLHLQAAPYDPEACSLALTLILQRKGRVLDAASETLNALRDRFNPQDQDLLDQLITARAQIAKLVLGGPQQESAEQYQARIKTLEEQAENFEAEISRKSGEFRAQSMPVTLTAVREAIPDDAALIEFSTYRPFDGKAQRERDQYGPPHYVAYVMHHRGEIRWKDLGEVAAIDQSIAALRKALRNPQRKDVKRLARILGDRVFQPIRPLLGTQTRLLISPEGSLNLIPFAALVNERGRYLVENYSISYLASGRDLLRLQVARESHSGPLVVANPDFGRPKLGLLARRSTRVKKSSEAPPAQDPAESAFSRFYFTALPDTAEEGKALRELLPGSTLLTNRRANKAALRDVRSPFLLHIATHGFFLEDPDSAVTAESAPGDSTRRARGPEKSGRRIENPLLRSGLVLAGANEHLLTDNGILTALEVTGLNLWGTKLVVLSGCDTGVGEVKNGDGVHGLRRALVLAGAETQVLSLWPVSDYWTRELMVAYYGRLQRGQGRGEALRQVQLKMLKDPGGRHPCYWASFIQSGEWANLDGER
ncbi:MAG TPA: tetratricopeptide repeat protein [Blastocatellia bacterium]|nr:tetratricopeptide repeat protein [Blastocatellia bacterium]